MTTRTQTRADSPVQAASTDRTVLIAFLLFVFIMGGASVAIRITYVEMAPFWAGASRFLLAGLVFWGLVIYKRIPLPKGRALLGAVLFGTLSVGLAFLLIAWGLVETPASRYQILMATVPLLTVFLAALHGVEALSIQGVLGSLLAVGGIVVTVGGAGRAEMSLPHIAAILLAALCNAEGVVLIKKFPPNPPIMINAIGLTIGGSILGIASLVSGESWNLPTLTSTWVAWLYLVIFVTIFGFLLYLFALSKWSASKTSYGFVLIPLVTIVVASSLAGEKITWNFLAGAGLVLAGVLIGALLPNRKKPVGVEEDIDLSAEIMPPCA